MNLTDVFEALASAELSIGVQVSNQELKTTYYNQIINCLNQGLSSIYKQLNLKLGYKTINIIEGVKEYELNSDKDILEVLHITDDKDIILPLSSNPLFSSEFERDIHSGFFVEMLTPTKIRLGKGVDTDYVTVRYKALHPKIPTIAEVDLGTVDTDTIELEISEIYLSALCYFIAHKIGSGKDAQSILGKNPFHIGNNFKTLYDEEMNKFIVSGYDIGTLSESSHFAMNGFV